MHSSRMRTARSSSRPGGGLHQAPPGTRHLEADPPEQTSPGPGTPRTRHLPREQTPLEQAPPSLEQAPLLLTESQTPVKI